MMLHRQTSAPYQSRFQENRGGDESIFSPNTRRWVRNQEHDEWLQMKADELERLFAEHKRKIAAVHATKSSSPEVDSDCVVSDDRLQAVIVRGEFYERYMRRRESKLREKWEVEREVREAKMKAMSESLERSSAMMMNHDRSSSKKKTTTMITNGDQLVEKNFYEEEDGKQFGDSSSKRTPPTKRSTSSSTSRKPIPRPSTTSKSSIVANKTSAQPISSFNRSKSTSAAGMKFFKEEKPKDTQVGLKPSVKKWNDTRPGRPEPPTANCSSTEQPNVTESSVAASRKTRKKWGSAQVPAVLASRHLGKDSGKGLIRFLQFGRKSKDADLEVDDNQAPPYGDAALLSDRASRSFFSLPSFRNRGDDSKLGR